MPIRLISTLMKTWNASSSFETTKDVRRILQNLMLASGQKILPGQNLVIVDEIQDCPQVINALKCFCENAPEYHVAFAGSLLGVTLAKPSSFPVGKVNFLRVDPITFKVFSLTNGDSNLVDYLESIERIEMIPVAFFNPLCEKHKNVLRYGRHAGSGKDVDAGMGHRSHAGEFGGNFDCVRT